MEVEALFVEATESSNVVERLVSGSLALSRAGIASSSRCVIARVAPAAEPRGITSGTVVAIWK